MTRIAKALQKLDRCAFLGPLIGRLTIAAVFVHSGYGKLTHLDKTIEFFASLGIHYPNLQAPFAAGMEFVCGLLVLLGLATRLAAIPLIVIMGVAIRTARWEDVDGFLSLFNLSEFLYVMILLGLIFTGAGGFSVDAKIRARSVS